VMAQQTNQTEVNAVAAQVLLITQAATVANSTATASSFLTQPLDQTEINAVAAQVITKTTAAAVANASAVTLQVMTQPKQVQPVYNTRLEALGSGFIPATDSGVALEVLAAIPFNANDYNVRLEALAESTYTPPALMTTVVWFTS
jgi:hypothetical protein